MQFWRSFVFYVREGFELASCSKHRDYLFDNCKALLILLVVMGHFMEPSYQDNSFLYILKWLIVSFHMPAFIFISGYFSKRELSVGALIQKLAVPYLVYEVVYYLLYTLVLHKETKLYLLLPKFSLWYILALFVWRLITPYVKRIPHHLLLSVAAGLLIGCVDMPNNFLSIPRILVFYPFFLAGIHCDRSLVTSLRTKFGRYLAAAGVTAFVLFLIFTDGYRSLSVKIFYGRYNYDYLDQSMLSGILVRIICYLVGAFMTYAILVLMTERKTFFSYVGTRTMAIYLFHGLTYSYLKDTTSLLQNLDTLSSAFLLLAFCTLLTFVYSAPQLTALTNRISSLHLPSIPAGRFSATYLGIQRMLLNPKI